MSPGATPQLDVVLLRHVARQAQLVVPCACPQDDIVAGHGGGAKPRGAVDLGEDIGRQSVASRATIQRNGIVADRRGPRRLAKSANLKYAAN